MIFQRATSRCCYGWERSTIVKSFQIDAALEVWRSGPCRRRSGWGVRRGICRVDHEGSPLWNFWNLASLKRLMAFPRFLIIKPELAKPKYLKIKALFRETSLICRVRLQICRVTLPLKGCHTLPSPRAYWRSLDVDAELFTSSKNVRSYLILSLLFYYSIHILIT